MNSTTGLGTNCSGGFCTTIDMGAMAVWAVGVLESVAVRVKLDVPEAAG